MRRWGFAAAVLLALLMAAPSAQAQFPGQNGKILFIGPDDGQQHIMFTINPDGTGKTPTGETWFVCCGPFNPDYRSQGQPNWAPGSDDFVFVEYHSDTGEIWQWIKLHSSFGHLNACAAGYEPENPAWSPDGQLIAFETNCGGEGGYDVRLHDVASNAGVAGGVSEAGNPDWSPDGSRLAFEARDSRPSGIWTANKNGTGATLVTSGAGPSWSPDGSKIALFDGLGANAEIYVVNSDGTGRQQLTSNATADSAPVWSPDGTKIAFAGTENGQPCLCVMNADGSGRTSLFAGSVSSLSWQSIPIDAYPRPKAATPMDVSLVPAHQSCGLPDRQHAGPLSHPSCAPTQQASSHLTVGTPDANSAAANSVGSVRLKAILEDPAVPGDQADVGLRVNITDVRRQSDLSDYTGELRVGSVVRATDKLNQPSPTPSGLGAATSVDLGFGPPVPCTATPDPAVGSTCAIDTTVDALIPGLVVGGGRSNWQFQEMRVFDGGPDEDGDTTGDNTIFLTQGVFVP